jgi:hypothetical protein
VSRRKARRRDYRATVCWYLVGLVAVQIGVGAVIECALPQLRDPVYGQNAARLAQRLAEYPDRPLLLALGSSRTMMGLDAGRMTSSNGRWLVFNFAELGGGAMLQQTLLGRLLAEGVRPIAVQIELVPLQVAAGPILPFEESSLDTGRLTAAELRAVSGYYRYPVTSGFRWLKARTLPCVDRQRALHDALDFDTAPAGETTVDAFGFWRCEGSPADADHRRERVRREFGPWLATTRLADGPVRAFEGLVALCRRERLPFTVVIMPEAESFRSLYAKSFCDEFDQWLAGLRREHEFPVIDARTWEGDDAFLDPHHLCAEGAVLFSDRLARDWLAGCPVPARSSSLPAVATAGGRDQSRPGGAR